MVESRKVNPEQKEPSPQEKLVVLRECLGETITNYTLRDPDTEVFNREGVSKRVNGILMGAEPDTRTRSQIDFVYGLVDTLRTVGEDVEEFFLSDNPQLEGTPLLKLAQEPQRVQEVVDLFVQERSST